MAPARMQWGKAAFLPQSPIRKPLAVYAHDRPEQTARLEPLYQNCTKC